jgi:hypothetical protein
VLPGDPRAQAGDVVRCRYLDERIAERRVGGEARRQLRRSRQVRFVQHEHETAVLGFGGDDPAVEQMLVDGNVRRDDPDDLRNVRCDQFFPERVGAVQQAAPRLDVDDRAAGRLTRHVHAVSARQRQRTAAEHAGERAATVELDDVMASMRGDDQAGGQRCAAARFPLRRRRGRHATTMRAGAFCRGVNA